MTRYCTIFLILAVIIPGGLLRAQESDSALVRIMVDTDSVRISVDQQLYEIDSYGNILSAGSWFILRLAPGEHLLSLDAYAAGREDSSVVLGAGTVFTWEVSFGIAAPGGPKPELSVEIVSDPDSATLYIDRKKVGIVAGNSIFDMSAGLHYIEVHREGYEQVGQNMEFGEGGPKTLKAILALSRPAPKAAADYGLELLPEKPLRTEDEAELIRKRFNGMAESFAVVPLAQGLLAKVIIGGEAQKEADILVLSGVVLTGGSYLLGKIFTARKKRQIREYNEIATRENQGAVDNNNRVRRETQRLNADLVKQWRSENEGRGVLKADAAD